MTIRFVLAGMQRSGTTFIRTCADSHPEARCIGEAFMIRNPRGKRYEGELGYPRWMDQTRVRRVGHYLWRWHNARRYLDYLYATPGFSAVGFKLMLGQARRFRSVIPYIKKNQVRVVHIVRKNVFKKMISRMTAHARGGVFHSDKSVEVKRVTVPVDTLLKTLRRSNSDMNEWQKIFSGKTPYMRLVYEDFVSNFEEESARMVDFLGLPKTELTSRLRKLNPDDLSKIVENLDEVRACLRNTEFEWCVV